MNTSEKNLLQNVGKTILQEPVVLEVDIKARGRIHAFLQRKRWMPSKRLLTIHPITLGNLIRISKILLEMDASGNIDNRYEITAVNAPHIARVIAIAIHNDRSEPPASLMRFIEEHFSSRDLLRASVIVLQQMDLASFMTTIISVKSLTVMSPKDQGRSIASGQPSEG